MSEPAIVLTDPKPIPKDGRCPRCRAPESKRQTLTAFGRQPWEACSSCGYEFPSED
jgi:rubredoxin